MTLTLRRFHGEGREDAAFRSTWFLEGTLHLLPALSPCLPSCLLSSTLLSRPPRKRLPSASQQTKLLFWKLLQLLRGLGPAKISFLYFFKSKDSGDGTRLISPGLGLPGRWRDSATQGVIHSINTRLLGSPGLEGSGLESKALPEGLSCTRRDHAPPHAKRGCQHFGGRLPGCPWGTNIGAEVLLAGGRKELRTGFLNLLLVV